MELGVIMKMEKAANKYGFVKEYSD